MQQAMSEDCVLVGTMKRSKKLFVITVWGNNDGTNVHLKPSQTSKTEFFAKIVNG